MQQRIYELAICTSRLMSNELPANARGYHRQKTAERCDIGCPTGFIQKFRSMLRAGSLEEKPVELTVPQRRMPVQVASGRNERRDFRLWKTGQERVEGRQSSHTRII